MGWDSKTFQDNRTGRDSAACSMSKSGTGRGMGRYEFLTDWPACPEGQNGGEQKRMFYNR